MANKQLQAAMACNRDVPIQTPGATQDSANVVNISIFFDGTRNNKDVDEGLKQSSNVARMFRAAALQNFYITGISAPYLSHHKATTAVEWQKELQVEVNVSKVSGADLTSEKNKINFEDSLPGSVAGAGGTRRTERGQRNVNDALYNALLRNRTTGPIATNRYLVQKKADGKDKRLFVGSLEYLLIESHSVSRRVLHGDVKKFLQRMMAS